MQFLTAIMMSILAGAEVDLFIPSFPELQTLFNLSPFMVELTLGANFCAYCVSALIVGNLGDRFGPKPIIQGGLLVFIFGSILCVSADSFWLLIVGRFLQGIGIAGPAALSYVVVSDLYSIERQQKMMGILNGITTIAMSFAPVIGSYINLAFKWRGNFMLLLVLGCVCFLMGQKWVPYKAPDKTVSLSLRAYAPLFQSRKFLYYTISICFMVVPYWVFIGISPILYMEGMNVSLTSFGYYQGAMAGMFAIVSLTSSGILKVYSQKRCFNISLGLCVVAMAVIAALGAFQIQNPLLITVVLMVWAAGIVFPINILYPVALESIKGAKSRMASFMLSFRLLLTAIGLQTVSYLYTGSFRPIAYVMCLSFCFSLYAILLLRKKQFVFAEKPFKRLKEAL